MQEDGMIRRQTLTRFTINKTKSCHYNFVQFKTKMHLTKCFHALPFVLEITVKIMCADFFKGPSHCF